MANVKITDLAAYTNPASTDVLAIVDVGTDVTKKVSIADLLKNAGDGTASAPGIAFDGDSNTGIYRPGPDQVAISTGGTGRLFVDSSGNVGVGTANPATYGNKNLEVNGGAGGAYLVVKGTSDAHIGELAADGNIYLSAKTSSALILRTTDTERMRLDSSGGFQFKGAGIAGSTQAVSFNGSAPVNSLVIDSTGKVGLGTSSPNYQLHVTTDFAVGASGFNQHLTFSNDTIQSLLLGTGYTALKLNPLGGNVGIGVTGPVQKLHIDGSALVSNNNYYYGYSSTGSQTTLIGITSSNNLIVGQDNANHVATTIYGGTGQIGFSTGGSERARIDISGRLLVGTSSQSGGSLLQVNDDRIRIASSKTPASASDTGTAGEICWDSSYIYVCTATDTWKRAALSTW